MFSIGLKEAHPKPDTSKFVLHTTYMDGTGPAHQISPRLSLSLRSRLCVYSSDQARTQPESEPKRNGSPALVATLFTAVNVSTHAVRDHENLRPQWRPRRWTLGCEVVAMVDVARVPVSDRRWRPHEPHLFSLPLLFVLILPHLFSPYHCCPPQSLLFFQKLLDSPPPSLELNAGYWILLTSLTDSVSSLLAVSSNSISNNVTMRWLFGGLIILINYL